MEENIEKKLFESLRVEDYQKLILEDKGLFDGSAPVLLSGTMGAGKTTFIKEICRFLGVEDPVSSPTFSLVNEYIGGEGRPIYHFDLFRIKSIEEIQYIGFTEYLDSGALCLIEWPEIIKPLLEFPYFEFEFSPSQLENRRDIELIKYE